ncbi:hypothetical protein ACN08N_06415 [Photobacterium leiognathi subsp. mandapamensis]|uniref:hypothetical protein n=1 Tax=Photobacterium leiognathi TaxID=553611 RepID=UPI003AF3DF60
MRFLLFLRLFLLFICAPIFAEESTPYKQIIATKINQLELQQKTPETVKQLAAYQAAQNQLEKIKDFNQATRRYEELTETYPEQKSAIKEQIDNFSATEFPEFSDWGHDQLTLEIAGQDTKNLSQKGFIPNNEATSKMQHGLVVFYFLFPTNEQPTITV